MEIKQTDTWPSIAYSIEDFGKSTKGLLYPVLGVNTKDHVDNAYKWLKASGASSIQVRWTMDTENQPDKIPDFLIIANLNKEIGGLKSYIDELEERLKKKEVDETREVKKEIQREALYKAQNIAMGKKEKQNNALRRQLSDLIIRMNQNPKDR